ncbi:leucine-rich repeat domain-containing protein [Noviherbaspirillum pedocola]|uniref:Uncharacterized protein n=1 Tax=Noviherbaspirillum pedocola TaxID=2801341 RepID=A0A934SRY2_9BURK|nr:hypothetical protein [Noviherbaspirillum pedocola]MBK4734163.1 hypothetical protein [Noviherbaspirillum pedocola]
MRPTSSPTSSPRPSSPATLSNAPDALAAKASTPEWQQFSQAVVNDGLRLRSPLSDASLQHLADWLASSSAELKALYVDQEAQVSVGGMQVLFKALKANTTLQTLEVLSNPMDQASAEALAETLKGNGTLDELTLRSCGIDEPMLAPLCEALKSNSRLTRLNLRENAFGDKGLSALSEALLVNKMLLSLDVNKSFPGECDPCFFDAGMVAVVKALRSNTTLTEIRLGSVEMEVATRSGLLSAVRDNKVVQVIGFHDMHFPQQDLQLLKSLLADNAACAELEKRRPAAMKGLRAMAPQGYPDELMTRMLDALIRMPSIPEVDRMTALRSLDDINQSQAAVVTHDHTRGVAPGS